MTKERYLVHVQTRYGDGWEYPRTAAFTYATDAVAAQLVFEYDRGAVAWIEYPHPLKWQEVAEERFDDMLNVLPPVAWIERGFLVGEPMDHDPVGGFPRFTAMLRYGGKFYESVEPLGVKEWRDLDMRETVNNLLPMKEKTNA